VNKLVPLNNINLSEILWIKMLHHRMPSFWLFAKSSAWPSSASTWAPASGVLADAPAALLRKDGNGALLDRGQSAAHHGVPADQDVLRWIFNLKYVVSIPEFAFNI